MPAPGQPNETKRLYVARMSLRISSDSHSSFDYASRSGLGADVLQAAEGVNERRLSRSRLPTNTNLSEVWNARCSDVT